MKPYTVRLMIEELSKHDPDAVVFIRTCTNPDCQVEFKGVCSGVEYEQRPEYKTYDVGEYGEYTHNKQYVVIGWDHQCSL